MFSTGSFSGKKEKHGGKGGSSSPSSSPSAQVTWEERSGFLGFVGGVQAEVERFDESFGFGLRVVAGPPATIDGDPSFPRSLAFLVIRPNALLGDSMTYCLYTVLRGGVLHAYVGLYEGENIRTLLELKPLKEFGEAGRPALYDWLRELVRASCEKLQ